MSNILEMMQSCWLIPMYRLDNQTLTLAHQSPMLLGNNDLLQSNSMLYKYLL